MMKRVWRDDDVLETFSICMQNGVVLEDLFYIIKVLETFYLHV